MTMSARPIWAFDKSDDEMRAALQAGWRRRDLWWERLQEAGNRALENGEAQTATRRFRKAFWLGRLGFAKDDPRRATGLANLACMARIGGSSARAERRYSTARELWRTAPAKLKKIHVQPRARSSLFHLRMELKHRRLYRANLLRRLRRFMRETEEALAALAQDEKPPHRLFSRWRGEKPPVFDDTRKLMAACLLIASTADSS